MKIERKTTRVYGGVAKAIRDVAASGKQFCVCDFEDPVQVRRMLSKLVRSGELKRVRDGHPGKEMTVYQKT